MRLLICRNQNINPGVKMLRALAQREEARKHPRYTEAFVSTPKTEKYGELQPVDVYDEDGQFLFQTGYREIIKPDLVIPWRDDGPGYETVTLKVAQ